MQHLFSDSGRVQFEAASPGKQMELGPCRSSAATLPLWSSMPTRLPVSIMLNGCSQCQPPPRPTHPLSAFPPFPAQWLKLAGALAPTHPLINAQKEGETFKEIPPTALTENLQTNLSNCLLQVLFILFPAWLCLACQVLGTPGHLVTALYASAEMSFLSKTFYIAFEILFHFYFAAFCCLC